MRHLLIVLLAVPMLAQSHEILRPTSDTGFPNVSAGCSGSVTGSPAMPLAYDSAGTSTGSNDVATATRSVGHWNGRVFTNWQTTTNTYTSLTINLNLSSTGAGGSGGGTWQTNYSLNGGSTWTAAVCCGFATAQTTNSFTIPAGTNLANVQVSICVEGDVPSGSANLKMWDIWTDGVYNPPPPPPPPANAATQLPFVASPVISN